MRTKQQLWVVSVTAPDDDEAYTPEQQAHDAEAQASIDRGEGIPHEIILREFRLKGEPPGRGRRKRA